MRKKGLFDNSDVKFVVINIALALLIGIAALIGLIVWLKGYTQHGVEIEVAEVIGMKQEQAESILAEQGLKMEVIDSTYSNKVPFGTIVEQNPRGHSHAKNGRAVYVIINATSRPKVTMPNLQDMSSRQALTTLRSMGLRVDSTFDYEPSTFRDLVLDVKSGGKSVAPGTKLEEGTRVRLVVGYGRGTEQVEVPNVIGMNLQTARATLLSRRLIVGAVSYDEEAQEGVEQVVYHQTPYAGEKLIEGETVALRLSSDLEKAVLNSGHKHDDTEEDQWF